MHFPERKIDLVRQITGLNGGENDIGYWVDLAQQPQKTPVQVDLGNLDRVYHPLMQLRDQMLQDGRLQQNYLAVFRRMQRGYETQNLDECRGACEDFLAVFGEEKFSP